MCMIYIYIYQTLTPPSQSLKKYSIPLNHSPLSLFEDFWAAIAPPTLKKILNAPLKPFYLTHNYINFVWIANIRLKLIAWKTEKKKKYFKISLSFFFLFFLCEIIKLLFSQNWVCVISYWKLFKYYFPKPLRWIMLSALTRKIPEVRNLKLWW